jgi:hypothetical protein
MSVPSGLCPADGARSSASRAACIALGVAGGNSHPPLAHHGQDLLRDLAVLALVHDGGGHARCQFHLAVGGNQQRRRVVSGQKRALTIVAPADKICRAEGLQELRTRTE